MSGCDADGASGARLHAVPGGQHGLCSDPADVHGETPGAGEGGSDTITVLCLKKLTFSFPFYLFR